MYRTSGPVALGVGTARSHPHSVPAQTTRDRARAAAQPPRDLRRRQTLVEVHPAQRRKHLLLVFVNRDVGEVGVRQRLTAIRQLARNGNRQPLWYQ